MIILAVALVLGIIVALLFARRSTAPMPVYKGRTAEEWLTNIWTTNQSHAMQAFREMGTNAFPVLIRTLEKREKFWERMNRRIYPRLPTKLQAHWKQPVSLQEQDALCNAVELVLINVPGERILLPSLVPISMDERCVGRRYALSMVASMARPEDSECLPALIQGLDSRKYGTLYEPLAGLQHFGPKAKKAVPHVVPLLQNSNIDVRVMAAVTLWRIDGQTNVAVAALREALKADEDSLAKKWGPLSMKGWAPIYLWQIDRHDESLIPALTDRLQPDGGNFALSAARIIGSYGSAAHAAVPALTNLLTSRNLELRRQALRSLKEIDPETAAKYENK